MNPIETPALDLEAHSKTQEQQLESARAVRASLVNAGLFRSEETASRTESNDYWRISDRPFALSVEDQDFIAKLGTHLLKFYEAANRLYYDSVKGFAPRWVAEVLDQGKSEEVVGFNRMKRFKQALPGIIRPDLIPTEHGIIATELDAVPGGIGLTAALSQSYDSVLPEKPQLVGKVDGMIEGFANMIRSLSKVESPLLAIVVSEESKSYRPEMAWLSEALNENGLQTRMLAPSELQFTEAGLLMEWEDQAQKIDVLYRFFELFDLKNIPKAELIWYAAKKKKVVLTPPPKPHLEEKLLFALFHHPGLTSFWQQHLGQESKAILQKVFPETWIVDPSALPPQAIIPGLTLKGNPITDFRQLGFGSQKERQWALKPSGFSELAWGSRGVSIGHDLSEIEWQAALDTACASFPSTPYILQRFHKGKKVEISYADFAQNRMIPMKGRVRLSPYYFVEGKEARLGGVLATVCSLEKKLIHGMVDAVIAPCALQT